MRVIHDPVPDEKIIAKGRYDYLRHGTPTGLVEHWSISQTPDGREIVRADVDARAIAGAASLMTHLLRGSDGRNQYLRLRLERPGFSAAAQYDFDTAEVKIFHQTFGHVKHERLLEIAARYGVDYHPVIAHDYVWRSYPMEAEGKPWSIPVFSPELWTPREDMVLDGRALRFTVTPLSPEPCDIPAGAFECALFFQITLSDGVRASAWYDEHGIPLRWLYPDKNYDFVLAEYSRG